MFSNIDEHARQPISPASEAALSGSSRKGALGVFSGARHLGLRKAGRIDVLRWERAHAVGERVLRHPAMRPPREVPEGSTRQSRRLPKKQRRSTVPLPLARMTVDRPEAGSAPSSVQLLEAG
jgi:hypothetical protein